MNIFATIINIIIPMLRKVGVPVRVLVEAARAGADAFFDVIEDRIADTDTKVDDMLVLPVINAARQLIGIEETVGSKYEDIG